MSNRLLQQVFRLVTIMVFACVAVAHVPEARAQGGRGGAANAAGGQQGQNAAPAGPAPKRDLNGAWVGPTSRGSIRPVAPYTALGQRVFGLNKPEPIVHLAATNDPFVTCDPLGFPRNVLNAPVINGGMRMAALPDRMLMLYQYQRVWREVWTDGRELPKNVNARGGPDSRFYGFSVGHWDGDYTFVIDTIGTDDRTWLDTAGHPHSSDMHVTERYTRVDQNNMEMTLTIDDPKIYTMPFDWVTKATYRWIPNQELDETFCVPSEGIAYRDSLARPAGTGDPVK